MSSVAPGARRKQKIKPLKKRAPDVSAPDTWTSLSTAIREIHNHNASNLSFEQNYRFAYQMVVQKQGDQLYNGVNSLVATNIDKLVDAEVKPTFPTTVMGDASQRSHESERFLKAVRSSWDDHIGSMTKLRDLLKYMDRVYVPAAGKLLIWDSGMKLFLEHMLKPPIRDHIVSAILNQIEAEREGYAINRSAVKSCVDILLQLQEGYDGPSVYQAYVEPEIIRSSRLYYAREGEALLNSCDAPEFLRKVEDRFASEDARAHHYLSRQTASPLSGILEETLVTPHLTRVMSMPNSGLDNMLDLDQTDNLSRLYRLFAKVPAGISTLKKALKDSILRRGLSLSQLADIEDDGNHEETGNVALDVKGKGKGKARAIPNGPDVASKWVEGVLALKDKFDDIWRKSFASDREIGTACNEAFEDLVNKNARAPEFISLFIDENLKKGLKGKSDEEVDAILDKTICVFRYLSDRDVFERYYKQHLAKRLLHGRSVSDDAERSMLSKLKVECGFHFTQKLEGMFIDMKTSSDTMEAYRKHLSKLSLTPDFDLVVTIMTSNNWPNTLTQSPPLCTLPESLASARTSFEHFYLARHNGRRLTWQLGLGNADVRVSFKSRKHDLNVSTLALVILLLFENLGPDDFLTYEEISSTTGMDEIELKRHLQSLACAKFKILKKHPPGRDIDIGDSFSFNNDFTSPMQRIKIGTVASSRVENIDERKETRDRIEEERRHQTEACIVRIMKDRKHMLHNDLINEVARQLGGRFQPQPMSIKKRIEQLIEREYLERCEDRKSYNYLA